MNTKLLTPVVLITLILTISLNTVALSSTVAPTDVIYFDLVVDEARQLLYGSDQTGGSVHIISMTTLQVVDMVSVGLQPSGMDMSPDGNKLAVALFGQGEIVILDLNTLTEITSLVPQGTFGPNKPFDVLFGRPGRLYSVGNPDSAGFDYVHVFNTDTWQEIDKSTEIMRAAPRLAMTEDQNTLYVSQVTFTPEKIYRFDITTDTPTQTAEAPHGPVLVNTLCVLPDSQVYSSRGQVWSADLSTMVGPLPAAGQEIECSQANQRVFITSGSELIAIDTVSLTRLFVFNLPGTGGVARLDNAEEYIYVSTNMGVVRLRADYGSPIFMPLVTHDYCTGFFDDFSDPTSGWEVTNDDFALSLYTNGEFLIHTKKSGYLYLYWSPACDMDNYTVEVDARWKDRTGGSYGLIFDIQPSFEYYYLFDINSDYQSFRLILRTPSGFVPIVPWTTSPAIHTGLSSNHLKVTRDGDWIALSVNGSELGTWLDSGVTGTGGVGIISSPYSDRPRSDALFDNFNLVNLPANSGVTATTADTSAETADAPRLEKLVEPAP